MNRSLEAGLATLRRASFFAVAGDVMALAGGFLARLAEGRVAAWCAALTSATPQRPEPVSAAFVVEASADRPAPKYGAES